jgi:AcrR family transcriptional regulator
MAAAKGKMKWRQEGASNPLDINEELFDAALNVFSRHSFGEASLNDIIKTAGLNKGSFYYRFYDKLDLYLSLLHRLGMEKLELFRQYDDENPGSDFFESIKKKAVLGLRFAKKEPRYNAFSRRILAEDAALRNVIRECFGDLTQDVLTGMIEDGKTKGQVRTDISTYMAAAVFSTILERIDLMVSPAMDDEDVLARVDELIAVLRDGMAR